MPYLIQELRDEHDKHGGKESREYTSTLSFKHLLGVLNYDAFAKIKAWMKANKTEVSYAMFAGIIGSLVCCILEIYRRLVAPYEDDKIKSNGDV